jgi:hypothetical protein
MDDHGLSSDDMAAVCRACAAFRLTGCTPSYLQAYLMARLEATRPALAARIHALTVAQMDRLGLDIQARQNL